jgi:hypothetical protein
MAKYLEKKIVVNKSDTNTALSLFEKRSGQAFYAIQPLSQGYMQTFFYYGYGTSALSYGAPHELTRAVEIKYMLDCLVAYNTISSSTLTDLNYIADMEKKIVRSGHGSARGNGSLFAHRVNGTGTISYNLPKTPAYDQSALNKGNIAFYTSASSSTDVTIAINGYTVETVSLVNTSNIIRVVEFDIPSDVTALAETDDIITITNNSATAPVYVICANLYKLNSVPQKNIAIDYFKVFDSTRSFRSNNGASDYAIFDSDTNLFCGSYHGGETSLEYNVKLDGITQDIAASSGTISLFTDCQVYQRTNIINKLTATIYHTIKNNGYDLEVELDGDMNVSKLFTAMATSDESLQHIQIPKFDMGSVSDGYVLPIGTNYISQISEGTLSAPSLRASIEFETFDDALNEKNGSYMLKSVGNYNKVYYSPINGSITKLENIKFATKHRFYD